MWVAYVVRMQLPSKWHSSLLSSVLWEHSRTFYIDLLCLCYLLCATLHIQQYCRITWLILKTSFWLNILTNVLLCLVVKVVSFGKKECTISSYRKVFTFPMIKNLERLSIFFSRERNSVSDLVCSYLVSTVTSMWPGLFHLHFSSIAYLNSIPTWFWYNFWTYFFKNYFFFDLIWTYDFNCESPHPLLPYIVGLQNKTYVHYWVGRIIESCSFVFSCWHFRISICVLFWSLKIVSPKCSIVL